MSLLVKLITGVLLAEAAVGPLTVPKTAEVAELKATIREWEVPTKDAKPYATGSHAWNSPVLGFRWPILLVISSVNQIKPSIPFATGVVHNMTATPEGRVYIVGIDKVGAVEVAK